MKARAYDYLYGSQTITSGASNIYVGADAHAIIASRGVANSFNVAGKLTVNAGGVASNTKVTFGEMMVAKGGVAKKVSLDGGKLTVKTGAAVSDISTVMYGSGYKNTEIVFDKNSTLSGANNFSGVIVKTSGALTISGSLVMDYATKMQGFETRVAGASVTVRHTNNRVLSLAKSNAKSTLTFDTRTLSSDYRYIETNTINEDGSVSHPGAYFRGWMLTASYEQTFAGKVNIQVTGLQSVGDYSLSRGINLAKNAKVTIKMNTANVGSVKLGGALKKNGFNYKVAQNDAGDISMSLTAVAGVMRKGTSKKETLNGTANCDIFYGGAGNDTIKGVNGHDVVFYDAKKWGKDTVAATKGSITVYMAGFDSGDVATKMKGKDMVITRAGVSGDSITLKNYSENTHNIIYGGTVNEFSKYLKASKPAAAAQNAARDALWIRTGLLA